MDKNTRRYFDTIHAAPDMQLGDSICTVPDNNEICALRSAKNYDELLKLASALNYRLRYRESIEIYSKAIELDKDRIDAYRQRAARYITTLQPEKAVLDLLKCRELGGDEADLSYRLGIAYYLQRDYLSAMSEEETCFA